LWAGNRISKFTIIIRKFLKTIDISDRVIDQVTSAKQI
jgi:hypothetical protein